MKFDISKFIVKHEYLMRIILVVCIMGIILFIAIQYTTLNRAYKEVDKQSTSFYAESAVHFCNYYKEQIKQINDNASRMSVDRKITPSLINSHVWYKIEAINQLEIYAGMLPPVREISVYFKDTNIILTSKYSYTIQQYLDRFSECKEQFRHNLTDVIMGIESPGIRFLSSYTNGSIGNDRFIVVKHITTGYESTYNTVLLYDISDIMITSNATKIMSNGKYGFGIFDGINLIYANSEFDRKICTDEVFLSFLSNMASKQLDYTAGSLKNSVFKHYDFDTGLTFISIIPEDIVKQKANDFYSSMRLTLQVLLLGIIAISIISIYIIYKPISSVIRNISTNSNPVFIENEFKTIENTIENIKTENKVKTDTIDKQRHTLLMYYLRNILYGFFNLEKFEHFLDKSIKDNNFIAIVIYDFEMDNENLEILQKEINYETGRPAYITDIPYENYVVVVGAIDYDADISLFAGKLKKILKKYHNSDCILGIGNIVDSLVKIRHSYLNALIDLENRLKMQNTIHIGDKNRQVSYYEEQLSQFLQCVQNGFMDEALEKLQIVFDYIHNCDEYINRNYVYYDLLVSYVNIIKDMHLEENYQRYFSDLTYFDYAETLLKKMKDSVKLVCGAIKQRRFTAENNLKNSIIKYVDDNFMDPNISLEMVSDYFGISVYTCSRYFKEYTGVCYKDYIISKRLDLSKELLISTGKNISQIAREVGFASSSYFVTWFKKNNGTSPSNFRKNWAKL